MDKKLMDISLAFIACAIFSFGMITVDFEWAVRAGLAIIGIVVIGDMMLGKREREK